MMAFYFQESAFSAGDPDSIPGLRISRGEGNGNPLQYSCLENPMDRGAWQTTVHGVAELDMMSDWHVHFLSYETISLTKFGRKWC